jgi:hypothetical protein
MTKKAEKRDKREDHPAPGQDDAKLKDLEPGETETVRGGQSNIEKKDAETKGGIIKNI